MASLITDRGRERMLEMAFRNQLKGATIGATPFRVVLITAGVPDVDDNLISDIASVAEMGTTNTGYTAGGISLARNTTDFDTLEQDVAAANTAGVKVKDLVWTAGSAGLNGMTWALFTDDNATFTAREIYAALDFGGAQNVSDTQTFTVKDLEIRATL